MYRGILIFALTLSLLVLTSCVASVPGKGSEANTKYFIVLGFGIISVNEPEESAVVSTSAQALGISVSDRPGLKFALGYSSSTVVTIPNGARDVRVEISQLPGRPFIVDSQSAILHISEKLPGGEK